MTEMTKIKVVTKKQVFTTTVPTEQLADCYKTKDIDFNKTLIIQSNDPHKDPEFIINGRFVESVTLTKIDSNEDT